MNGESVADQSNCSEPCLAPAAEVKEAADGLGELPKRRLPRGKVRQVALETALEFQGASVQALVPIFICRVALDRLRHELCGDDSIVQ